MSVTLITSGPDLVQRHRRRMLTRCSTQCVCRPGTTRVSSTRSATFARSRSRPRPAQIAAGLSDRFGLLTGGVRGAPARQRTLEASLEWGYDLLDEMQRVALAGVSEMLPASGAGHSGR